VLPGGKLIASSATSCQWKLCELVQEEEEEEEEEEMGKSTCTLEPLPTTPI